MKEMYGDQFGEFVCGYWGFKGSLQMLHNIILPKILDQSFTKLRILLIPLSIAFSNPKILGFLFLRKIA